MPDLTIPEIVREVDIISAFDGSYPVTFLPQKVIETAIEILNDKKNEERGSDGLDYILCAYNVFAYSSHGCESVPHCMITYKEDGALEEEREYEWLEPEKFGWDDMEKVIAYGIKPEESYVNSILYKVEDLSNITLLRRGLWLGQCRTTYVENFRQIGKAFGEGRTSEEEIRTELSRAIMHFQLARINARERTNTDHHDEDIQF